MAVCLLGKFDGRVMLHNGLVYGLRRSKQKQYVNQHILTFSACVVGADGHVISMSLERGAQALLFK